MAVGWFVAEAFALAPEASIALANLLLGFLLMLVSASSQQRLQLGGVGLILLSLNSWGIYRTDPFKTLPFKESPKLSLPRKLRITRDVSDFKACLERLGLEIPSAFFVEVSPTMPVVEIVSGRKSRGASFRKELYGDVGAELGRLRLKPPG